MRNLWSKATGWGITANIVDCYEALMIDWRPGVKIGFFGFSRGAYAVARCLGGVLATCGIATRDGGGPISAGQGRAGSEEPPQDRRGGGRGLQDQERGRKEAGPARTLAGKYAAAPTVPDVVGVFDTVQAPSACRAS